MRKMRIDDVCREHYQDLYFEDIPFVDHLWDGVNTTTSYLNYLPIRNTLFCGIPKAGTTTWVEGNTPFIYPS